jgi:chromosome segregation ATPase
MSDENLQLKSKLASNSQRVVAVEEENEKLLVQLPAALRDNTAKVTEWTTQLRVLGEERDHLRDQLDRTRATLAAETERGAALASATEELTQRLSTAELQY